MAGIVTEDGNKVRALSMSDLQRTRCKHAESSYRYDISLQWKKGDRIYAMTDRFLGSKQDGELPKRVCEAIVCY